MAYVYSDWTRQDILRMIPPDGKIIGSVGCGKAATEAVLVGQGREVHGVDIAPEAIEVAKERITSARLISPDDYRPFPAESLDGLILADVLEHIPKAWEALAALAEAVRVAGWVVISVPNMRYLDAIWQFVVRGDWPEPESGIFDATHVQVMTHRRLERWCRSADLKIQKCFDRPHGGWRRNRWRRLFDRLTCRWFHSWFQGHIQVVCRKVAHTRNDGG